MKVIPQHFWIFQDSPTVAFDLEQDSALCNHSLNQPEFQAQFKN